MNHPPLLHVLHRSSVTKRNAGSQHSSFGNLIELFVKGAGTARYDLRCCNVARFRTPEVEVEATFSVGLLLALFFYAEALQQNGERCPTHLLLRWTLVREQSVRKQSRELQQQASTPRERSQQLKHQTIR
eukprot:gb/GECG01014137.1/.p1 GENE.gb/GECG01014137.1/~~gb/GECG01014137.1/.p1  ORF type:complete len:130 (+),score=10.64 gb/GECG01014137.1/:1-390(+)